VLVTAAPLLVDFTLNDLVDRPMADEAVSGKNPLTFWAFEIAVGVVQGDAIYKAFKQVTGTLLVVLIKEGMAG